MANQTNTVPNEWPGAFGIFKRSQKAVLVNIFPLLGLIVLFIGVSFATSIILSSMGVKDTSPLQSVVDIIVSSALTVSFTLLILSSIRGQKMGFGASVKGSLSVLTLKMILLTILTGIIAVVSFLLLIVPFFIVVPRISLAPYFLVDKNMGVWESVKASWNATSGSLGKLWGVIGVSILFGIAIVVLVGIYLSIMYAASFGLLYTYLSKKQPRVA